MSEQRTVLVESISYLGTDGESHVGVRGEKITIAKEGVEAFDWVHESTPEAKWAKKVAEAAKAAAPSRASKASDSSSPAPKG